MKDPTKRARRDHLAEINDQPKDRTALEALYGQVWDTRQLAADFIVLGMAAPSITVQRKADGVKGSLEFQHAPRFYFTFRSD